MKRKAISSLISAVMAVAFVVSLGVIYQQFAKDYIKDITQKAEQNSMYHGYSLEECARFQPVLVSMAVRSNLSYQDPLKVSDDAYKEVISHSGKATSKYNEYIITVWQSNNASWYVIYDHAGNKVSNIKYLTNISLLSTSGKHNGRFVVVDQYYNGSNYEFNLSLIDTSGNVISSKRLTFNEENQMIPAIASNGTHIAIAYVNGRNESMDIQIMLLDDTLNVVDIENITSSDAIQYNPTITWFGNKFYVAYENYEYGNAVVQLSSYDKGVVNFLGNVSTHPNGVYLPALASSSNYMIVAYQSGVEPNSEVRYTIYDISLNRVRDNEIAQASTNAQVDPDASYGNGKFTVVWNEKDALFTNIVKGVRISDLTFDVVDSFSITTPPSSYANSIDFDAGVFAILSAGLSNTNWDVFLRFISDKRFVVILQNPSDLNVTLTSFDIFFNDGSYCKLRGSQYIEAKTTEQYFAYDCDPVKQCQDIDTIRLGSECGVREFSPLC